MELLFSFTPQLYFFPKFRTGEDLSTLTPEPIASGVLVDIQGEPFLLTARHVFDYRDAHIKDIAIRSSKGFISLDGLIAFYPRPEGQNDIKDIAVIALDVSRVAAIKEIYSFLPWQNMNFDHVVNATDTYWFGGYINNQTERKGNEYTILPFGFETFIRTDLRIEKLGFSPTDNIPLKYNIRKQRRENENYQSRGPQEMQGLSGCGIWHIVKDEIALTRTFALVGIFIEGILNKGVVFGTHIRLVKPLLKDYFFIDLP